MEDLGAAVIDADSVGHEAYRPHSEIWQEVVATFGEGILQSSGEVDRKALGAIVFADPEARSKLNSIMHPRMAKIIAEQIRLLSDRGADVVLEAALLVEAGWAYLVNEIWCTYLPEDEAIRRISRRNSLPEAEIKKRVNAQMPAEAKLEDADIVIDNSGTVEELRTQVEQLWNSRVKERTRQE